MKTRRWDAPRIPYAPGRDPELAVAVVHDAFVQLGGGERVAAALAAAFGAPLFAAARRFDVTRAVAPDRAIGTTIVQRLVSLGAPLRGLAPLLPAAFGLLDVGPADVLVSSSSAFAHHARAPRNAVHVCYCHTPPRFLWEPGDYFQERSRTRTLLSPALAAYRRLDVAAARRIDVYVANSRHVASKIRDVYGRDAIVVYPPVETRLFRPTTERSGRFLVVSRLRAQKRIDLAVRAATMAGMPLDVIGEGSELQALRRQAGPTVRFLGRLPDRDVRHAMARATAVLVPAVQDFGLTVVEAQASGRPPIAFAAGGALEIVDDGRTGFLFQEQTPAGVARAMRRALATQLDVGTLIDSARRFDVSVFQAEMRNVLVAAVEGRRALLEPARVIAEPLLARATISPGPDIGHGR